MRVTFIMQMRSRNFQATALFVMACLLSFDCNCLGEEEVADGSGKAGVLAGGKAAGDFTGKLGAFLTPEMAAAAAGKPESEPEVSYRPSAKHPETDVISYTWDTGRKQKRKIGAAEIEVPVRVSVKAGWLRKSDMAAMKAKLQLAKGDLAFEEIPSLGEYTLWNTRDQQLIVLKDGLEFSVWVQLSEDIATNKAGSIKVARTILSGKPD